jgi:hypothetical protein
MKKTVWTFGLISGAVLSVMMAITIPFQHEIGYDRALIIGYTTMVLAFLLIFFGIKSYRDNLAGGRIKFGRAFVVGALIAFISSLCYVATWEVIFFKFQPDFLEKYQARAIEQKKASGAPQAEIDKQIAADKVMAERYKNPFFNAAFTLVEPLPVGLLIALVSAAVLSRRRRGDHLAMSASAATQ